MEWYWNEMQLQWYWDQVQLHWTVYDDQQPDGPAAGPPDGQPDGQPDGDDGQPLHGAGGLSPRTEAEQHSGRCINLWVRLLLRATLCSALAHAELQMDKRRPSLKTSVAKALVDLRAGDFDGGAKIYTLLAAETCMHHVKRALRDLIVWMGCLKVCKGYSRLTGHAVKTNVHKS